MTPSQSQEQWSEVYTERAATVVSRYQPSPKPSLDALVTTTEWGSFGLTSETDRQRNGS
jgi:hypothetical protein